MLDIIKYLNEVIAHLCPRIHSPQETKMLSKNQPSNLLYIGLMSLSGQLTEVDQGT